MVRALHAEGLEVILDVVYNHTGEGNHLGPTLSLKGIDNTAYYRLSPEDPRFYVDYTGTGNTVDTSNAPALRLVLDSLRYWVTEMHVDGFRFDLASALGRDAAGAYTWRAPFFAAIAQTRALARQAHRRALGPGARGLPAGRLSDRLDGMERPLPRCRARLLGQCRRQPAGPGGLPLRLGRHAGAAPAQAHGQRQPGDRTRRLHAGRSGQLQRKAQRSQPGRRQRRREPQPQLELRAEGDTDDPAIVELRARQTRNLLATLFLSHGTPLCWAETSWGARRAATTTATARTPPSPGTTGSARSRPSPRSCRPSPPN